jgi:UDP-glucose 4-epimerase
VYDNLSHGQSTLICDRGACQVIQGDIRDRAAISNALRDVRSVIHLAAFGSVVDSVTDPVSNFDNNVLGTFNVLDCSRLAGVEKLVFASTGGALIGDADPPVDEKSLPKPISPYGASKLCGEGYCHAFGQAYGIKTVALRFANVYGPYSAHKKGAITAFIKAVLTGHPIQIFGDGNATRDFLYVEDLCMGLERALIVDAVPGSVFHIASGVETRIVDLARMIARQAGRPQHPIEFQPKRAGEVERNFARGEAARAAIGFEAEWSLETGLAATLDWFTANGN